MKKIFFLIATMAITLFTACNFSKGAKKDLNNGLSTIWNGFTVDDVYFSDTSGNRLTSNKIKIGSIVLITATGIENYTTKDGKVYPGCSIMVIDKDGKEVLTIDDAFSSLTTGASEEDGKTLTATLATGTPMKAGETYHLKARFWDKEKNTNEIVSQADLLIE